MTTVDDDGGCVHELLGAPSLIHRHVEPTTDSLTTARPWGMEAHEARYLHRTQHEASRVRARWYHAVDHAYRRTKEDVNERIKKRKRKVNNVEKESSSQEEDEEEEESESRPRPRHEQKQQNDVEETESEDDSDIEHTFKRLKIARSSEEASEQDSNEERKARRPLSSTTTTTKKRRTARKILTLCTPTSNGKESPTNEKETSLESS
jgi:hypothetical protein